MKASLILLTGFCLVACVSPSAACDGALCRCGKKNSKHREPTPAERIERSGNAFAVAPWARLTYGPKYKSYVVGGSQAPFHFTPLVRQDPRQLTEGVWGTDFAPWYSKVELSWTHGQLHQDGKGQYEPDRKNVPFFLRFGRSHEVVRPQR